MIIAGLFSLQLSQPQSADADSPFQGRKRSANSPVGFCSAAACGSRIGLGVPAAATFFESLADADAATLKRLVIFVIPDWASHYPYVHFSTKHPLFVDNPCKNAHFSTKHPLFVDNPAGSRVQYANCSQWDEEVSYSYKEFVSLSAECMIFKFPERNGKIRNNRNRQDQ